jgi:hypothetical protein
MSAINRNPANTDLLQSTKFRVTFSRLQGITYFCQTANLPGISLTEIPRATPFIDLFHPGEKAIYDTFNVTFLVDEDLRAWTELHDWIRGLTFPSNFDEYLAMQRTQSKSIQPTFYQNPAYSDAVMTIYTNKNNPNFRVKLYDLFPTNIGTISFNTSDSAENIITADATFRFSYYDYERLRGTN